MKQKISFFIITIIIVIVQTTSYAQTNIFEAIQQNDTIALKQFLKNGTNPNYTDTDGLTPLLYTAGMGLRTCARILIKYGADINMPDINYGTTPLMFAAKYKQLEMCIFLVENGAEINKSDKEGNIALNYAEISENSDIYNYLQDTSIFSLKDLEIFFLLLNNDTTKLKQILAKGADPNFENSQGSTPLLYCSYFGQIDCAKILINNGANINQETKIDNGTALMAAVLGNQYEMCVFLINNGADMKIKTIKDRDVFYYAIELEDSTGCKNVLELIEKPKKHKFNIKLETWENIDYKLQLYLNINNIGLLKKYLIYAEQKADKEFKEEDTTYALRIYEINNYYFKLGDTINTERTYLKTKKLTEKSFGEEHSNYFIIMAEIVNYYANTGNKEKTIKYADIYTELMPKFYNETDSLYAKDMFEVGKIYHNFQSYEKAEKFYLKALTLIENFYGRKHEYYTNICNSLRFLYEKIGNNEKAIEYYKKSIEK